MFTATSERVQKNTAPRLNERIQRKTERNVACFAFADKAALDRRIAELNEEWDVERTLEANASALVILGIALGTVADRKWFLLPGIVGGFLMQHALKGWCPPLPVLRRLGFRTAEEIAREKYALKVLRGDFDRLSGEAKRDVQRIVEAVH